MRPDAGEKARGAKGEARAAAADAPAAIGVRQLHQLAAAMAHEVRNPLNSMAIHAELLEGRLRRVMKGGEGVFDPEAALKSVAVLAHEIERIDRILDEYLRFAGPREAARRPILPTRLLELAVTRVRPAAESRGVSLRIETTPGAWSIDDEALGEALDAVLANAVEASERGQRVEVSARSNDHEGEITVRDYGCGMSGETLGRAFQLGYSQHGRAGLGLAVAKQIVKGQGGAIALASEGPGRGSTLTMRLPLDATSEE